MKRIVVTGGPGAGKTASLETARHGLCSHVAVAPESASIVFGGGFPREVAVASGQAAQRAIFHVQRELEAVYAAHHELDGLLCDRGTVDCAAYWPGDEAAFYEQLGTTREHELGRYELVIHLRPPLAEGGYVRRGLRIESAVEAAQIDARIERAWRGHPRRVFVDHTRDFVAKVARVLAIVEHERVCEHANAALAPLPKG